MTKTQKKYPRRKPTAACQLDPQIKADLQAIADRDHRTLAGLMEHVLSAYAEQNQPKSLEKSRKKGQKSLKNQRKLEKTA